MIKCPYCGYPRLQFTGSDATVSHGNFLMICPQCGKNVRLNKESEEPFFKEKPSNLCPDRSSSDFEFPNDTPENKME